MTPLEYAERLAKQVRYAEQVRWDERKRAWDLIEVAAFSQPEEVAVALWGMAAAIMEHRSK